MLWLCMWGRMASCARVVNPRFLRGLPVAALLFLFAAVGFSQSTQGLISGRLVSSVTGRPIAGASVSWASSFSNLAGAAQSDGSGYYYLPLLSPGFYRLRVTEPAYQSQEVQELELTVAARIELDFRLRPLDDVWESGQYNSVFLPGSKTIVTFFGPDVDPSKSGSFEAQKGRSGTLESTVSEVIDSGQIDNLPLEGRDVYTMLVTQPGVTSDAATGRGLGLAVNGQRPSASNFLLDGLENNNYLITGPLVKLGARSDPGIPHLHQQLLGRIWPDFRFYRERHYQDRRRSVSWSGIFLPDERCAERE